MAEFRPNLNQSVTCSGFSHHAQNHTTPSIHIPTNTATCIFCARDITSIKYFALIPTLCFSLHQLKVVSVRVRKRRDITIILHVVHIGHHSCPGLFQSLHFLLQIIHFQVKHHSLRLPTFALHPRVINHIQSRPFPQFKFISLFPFVPNLHHFSRN